MSIKNLFFAIASLVIGVLFIATALGFVDGHRELQQSGVRTKVISINNIKVLNQRHGSSALAQSLVQGDRYSGEVSFMDGGGLLVSGTVHFSKEVIDKINDGKVAFVIFNPKNQSNFFIEHDDSRQNWILVGFGVFFLLVSNGFFRKIKTGEPIHIQQSKQMQDIKPVSNEEVIFEMSSGEIAPQFIAGEKAQTDNTMLCPDCGNGHVVSVSELLQSENKNIMLSRSDFVEPVKPKNRIYVAIAIGFVLAWIFLSPKENAFMVRSYVGLGFGTVYYRFRYSIQKAIWHQSHKAWITLIRDGYWCTKCQNTFIVERAGNVKHEYVSLPMPLA